MSNNSTVRQNRLYGIRHINWHPIVAVPGDIIHIDPHHGIVVSHAVSAVNRNRAGDLAVKLDLANLRTGVRLRGA